jgi:hypothetical protein
MAININKGSELGKYYYSKNNVVFGPIPLEELLKFIDADTLVYYEGIKWTEAKNLPELKKIVDASKKEVEPIYIQNYNSQNEVQLEKKKTPWGLIFVIVSVMVVIYFINQSTSKKDDLAVTAVDTTSLFVDTVAATPQILSYNMDDIYNNILSKAYISQTQLDNLSYIDLIDYKNELLARHGFIFEDDTYIEYYRTKGWYSPVNNYLVATSQFNEFEYNNFQLIENKLVQIQNKLTSLIQGFYQSIVDQTFDANQYFSPVVDQYITKRNITPTEINSEMTKHYEEFINSKYSFSDPFQISILRDPSRLNYVTYEFHYAVERASKQKLQECDVVVKLGFDANDKIISYSEEAIKNLTFTDLVKPISDTLTY